MIKIPVNTPLLNGNEAKYLNECIASGWISSEGPFVSQFENLFSKKVGRLHGIALTNGTSALEAAIEAIGLEQLSDIVHPLGGVVALLLGGGFLGGLLGV